MVSFAGWTAVQRAGLSVVLANQLRWVAALFSCGAWSVLTGRLCWLVSCAGCCAYVDLAEPPETFSLHTARTRFWVREPGKSQDTVPKLCETNHKLFVATLRGGHANALCIVPILTKGAQWKSVRAENSQSDDGGLSSTGSATTLHAMLS